MIETTIDGLRAEIPGTRSQLLSFERILVSVPIMILMPPLLLVFPLALWLRHADVALRVDLRRLHVEQGPTRRTWLLEELASIHWEPWGQRPRRGQNGKREGNRSVALIVRERSGTETRFPGLLRLDDEAPRRADYDRLCAMVQQAIEHARDSGTAADVPEALRLAQAVAFRKTRSS